MADFKYVAVDAQGKTQSGEVSAKDGKEARSALRKQRLTPSRFRLLVGVIRPRSPLPFDCKLVG